VQPDLVPGNLDADCNVEIDMGHRLDPGPLDDVGDLGFLFDRHIADGSSSRSLIRLC